MKAIAEALARGMKVAVVSIKPEEAEAHFGWSARFAGHDIPASGAPVAAYSVPVRFALMEPLYD